MRKVSLLICKNYKSPVFHNTEDLNQLKSNKDYSLKRFAYKGNNFLPKYQTNTIKKACSPAGQRETPYRILLHIIWKKLNAKVRKNIETTKIYSDIFWYF